MGRVFASKDFLAGTLFTAFGLLGLWLGRTLPVGAASAMEAGYFPRLVCTLLVVIGAALAMISLFRAGDALELNFQNLDHALLRSTRVGTNTNTKPWNWGSVYLTKQA